MRRSAIVVGIIIIAANILGLILLNKVPPHDMQLAGDGVLSLEDWDFGKQGRVTAGGTWEFYPGVFIIPAPDREVFQDYSKLKEYVKAPGKWEIHEKDIDPVLISTGTLRLRITLPEEGNYGIESDSIQYPAAIYINGVKVFDSGLTEKDLQTMAPAKRTILGIANSKGKQMEIVIHVAYYSGLLNDVLHTISIGTSESLLGNRDKEREMDFFVIFVCLIIGITLSLSFLLRKGSKNSFYIGIFLIFQGIYIATIGEQLIHSVVRMPKNSILFYNFQIHIMYLSILSLLLLANNFFHKYTKKGIIIFLCILLGLIGPLFLWTPGDPTFSWGMSVLQHKILIGIILGVPFGYFLYIMRRAFQGGIESAGMIFVIVVSYCCYLLSLGIGFLFGINIGRLPTLMMLFMILTQILFMNYRSKLAFRKVEQLSSQLLLYDEMKDKFLAKTSRELRKPADSIINNADGLLEGQEGSLNYQQQQKAFVISCEGRHIINILDELLVASGENTDISITPESIDRRNLEDIINELEYLAGEKEGLKLISNIPEEFPCLWADKSKLKQILYHLIQNGVKFTNEGDITVSANIHGDMAFIEVKDTGTGIEKAQRNIIFTPFFQGKKTGEAEGLGLGLGITKNLVELQGGRIWVVSDMGKGSQFTFSIPLDRNGEKKTSRETENGTVPAGLENENGRFAAANRGDSEIERLAGQRPETVLAAIRDKKLLTEMKRLNEELKCTIIIFDSNGGLLEYVQKESIDLVLLDTTVKDITSCKVCESIREQYTVTELPVIILAEDGQYQEVQKVLCRGANDFIKRSCPFEELKVRIQTMLSVKKSAEEAISQEMQNLYAQIVPHFLYNTLNTIIGLSFKDAEKTCEALQNLSTYFRAKLDFSSYNSLVSIEREMELVKAYLDIEKIRYNSRLEILYDLEEGIDILLPALTLQPLAENAVHHGIQNSRDKVTVEISIKRTPDNRVAIKITDNGPGIPKEKREELMTGRNNRIGLSNVIRKIKLMKNADILLESSAGEGTCITIYVE